VDKPSRLRNGPRNVAWIQTRRSGRRLFARGLRFPDDAEVLAIRGVGVGTLACGVHSKPPKHVVCLARLRFPCAHLESFQPRVAVTVGQETASCGEEGVASQVTPEHGTTNWRMQNVKISSGQSDHCSTERMGVALCHEKWKTRVRRSWTRPSNASSGASSYATDR
jgi:hypothetical protein